MQTADASLKTFISASDDIDWEKGCERVNGNKTLYLKLLRLYFSGDGLEKLSNSLRDSHFENTRYEAHNMKGTAANLGLIHIAHYANEIDVAIRNHEYHAAQKYIKLLQNAHLSAQNAVSDLFPNEDIT